MKALITGGAGFIGSHLVELLIKTGWDISVVDNLYTGVNNISDLVKFGNIMFSDISITHPGLQDIFAQAKPDYVFHLAAIPEVQTSIDYPEKTAEINILGTIRVVELCKKFNVKKIVFSPRPR